MATSKFFLLLAALPCLLHPQTTVTLTTTPNPSIFGAAVTLTATVTPATAAGKVTFYDGVTVLGTKPLVSGVAQISTIALPAGSRKVRAYYAGATSNVVTEVVQAVGSAGLVARSLLSPPVAAVFAVGDFNGDGKPDLVINDGTANTIGVLLANGNGSFQTAHVNANLGPGFTAGVVAVADFNGDGKADFVATTSSGNSLAIVLGNGDGTFGTPLIIPFPGPDSVAVGDFNGDGKADLLVLNGGIGGIGILPGNGDGTFQSPIAAVPATISSVVIGDFNGDGKPDLAFYDLGVNSVRILLGKGDGTFQQAASYPLQSVIGLTSGDFNGDGKADLAITVNSNQNSQVNILLGNGDGTFQTGMSYSAAGQGRSPSVGDFNGDGNADLVLSGSPVSVLLGNGDGTFQPPVTYATAFNASSLIVGDFNGDGRTDLLLADGNFLLGTTVSVTPAGTPQSTVVGTAFPSQLQVTVKDGANPISGVAVTFAAPSSGPSAVLSSTIAMTDANGVATVTATANTQTGSYTVTATATALGVSATFALTNLAGPPSVITASPAVPESAQVGTAFPKPLAVTLTDSSGLPASGVAVTFSAPASGASAALSSGTAVTNASGVASVTATANNIPGAYTVTARAGGLSATFSLSNVQPATVSLASSANPSTFGASLTLAAAVSNPAATGFVTFFDGVNILGSKPVSAGSASISTILLPAGSRKLTAYYSGDANYIAATSNVLTQTVKAVAGGTLLAQSPIALPAAPSSVAVGDFNGDGKPDFAFPYQDTVSWWQVDLGAPASIGSVVIWGRTDCCVTRLSDYWIFVSNTPFLPTDTPASLQNRAGTFSSHQTGISAIAFPSATIAVNGAAGRYVRVQLSNPGFLSLAEVQVFGTGAPATNLALGKAASQSSTYPGYPSAAAGSAVDGNTDGNFFDGSVTSTGLGFVTIMLGKGDGTFQSPVNYAIGEAGGLIVTGDFNRDGIADLALTTVRSDGLGASSVNLTILLGNGDGTFGPSADYPVAATSGLVITLGYGPMAIGDFNGDGKADILIASQGNAGSEVVGGLYLMPGNGDGSFQAPILYPFPAFSFVVADFNGDSKPDLAAIGGLYQTGSILLGNGDGTYQSPINLSGAGNFVVGDFNGDGKTDLAASGFTFISGNPIASTLILLGNGDGTFQTSVGYPFGTPVTSGDFNGDGIADLVLVDSSGDLSGVLYGNGDGTFHQGIQLAGGTPLAVADFNGDGRADILTLSPTGVTVLLGATGATISLTATGGTPQSAATGAAFAQPLQVTVLNGGSPVAGATVTFTVPTVGPSATLSSNTAVTNASGVASVAATANSIPGSYNVAASYNGVNATFSLTNTLYAFLVATGGTPQSTAVGTPFATALQATVKNALGSPVSGVTVTFAAPTVGATATLSSTTAVSNASGVASVNATANNIGGSYAVTATVGALSTSFSLTNTGGQAASIAATGGTPQSAALGAAFASPLQATVKDGSGNPLAGITVTFAAPTVGATALLSSTTAVTNAAGIASVTATANLIAGSYSVTASVGTASTSFSLTNVPGASGDLAAGKTATQSSTLPGYSTAGAGSAVDGNTDGQFFDGSVTATNQDANPWWQVDLGASSAVSSVVIWNRTDCCASRLSDYWIFISDTPFLASDTPATLQNRAATFASHQTTAPNPSATIAAAAQGRYVRVQLTSAGYLSLAEVQVFGGGGGPPPPTNLAQGKAATQSSTLPGYAGAGAGSAADGNTDGSFYDGSVTATNADSNAWWQVDLGASSTVNSVVVWNRTDCCGSRLSDYWVFVSNTPFLASDTPATLANRAGTFASHQTAAPNPSTTILVGMQGRYVRVQLSDTDYLSLAEVQVLGTGPPSSNLAQGKAASQSSTLPGYADGAAAAVDGNTDGNFYDGSVTATNQDANPWWQVDLGASAAVSSVAIYNRTDCCGSRLSDYWVFISDTPFLASDTPATLQNRAGTFASHQTTAPNPSTALAPGAEGRYVRVQLTSAGYLSLAEVQVFGQ